MTRTRYVPSDSEAIAGPDGLSIVYLYASAGPCAIAYVGRKTRPTWHVRFRSTASRDEAIARLWQGIAAHAEQRAKERANRSQPHNLQVGDIVYNSWGYDQTNIDWYQVVKRSDHFVWLRRIQGTVAETGFMSGSSQPQPGRFTTEKVEKHKAYPLSGDDWVNFEFGAGRPYEDRPEYVSWYA